MIETINGKAYFKVGDKVYELGGGSNIITADSVEQLPDPASVPEGTIALVKSEGGGGGGLPMVELSTTILFEDNTQFTSAENTALTTAFESGKPFSVKANLENAGQNIIAVPVTFTTNTSGLGLVRMIAVSLAGMTLQIFDVGAQNNWTTQVQNNG